MYFDTPILITGCARSGTSMTAGIVHLCGAWGGAMRGPNMYNPKGMFENVAIVNDLVKPYLRALKVDPLGQDPLPDTENVPIVQDWHLSVLMKLKEQGYSGERWFYKGAKNCLIWPVFHAAFPKAKWIIVRRDAEQIAASCLRTSFMRAFNNEEGWLQWVKEHELRFQQMRDAGLNVIEVWPQEAMNNLSLFRQMIEWCELDWKEREVIDFIDPGLWDQRR